MESVRNEIRTTACPRCFVCGAEGKLLYESLTARQFEAAGKWNFRVCPNTTCGLIWLDPMPIQEDLALAYQNYFTHGGGGNSRVALRDALYRGYKAASSLPAAMVGLLSAKERMGKMFLDDLSPGRILDVGCGGGQFLRKMRQAGWAVEGVDFDAKAIGNARAKFGLELHHGDLASVGFAAGSFDAVTMSHVIEHVPQPVVLLKEVWRVLRPGGRLVVTTPNSGSLGHQVFRGNWMGLDPPRHLHVFSLGSLGQMARAGGFELQQSASSAANADVFIGASISIASTGGRLMTHQPRPDLLRTLRAVAWQYREFFTLPTRPDCGEECVLICKRPERG